MASSASPTAFHKLLKWLDDEGKLFRVYTQFVPRLLFPVSFTYISSPSSHSLDRNIDGLESKAGLSYGLGLPTPSNSTVPRSRSPSPSAPPSGVPRCIPLHGVLSTLHCPHCAHITSIDPHLPLLSSGSTSPCPACLTLEETRNSLGERSRGVGWLKPSVVLYGEPHPQAERVGEITRKDLMGPRPDLLLVVGTSLKVPGTKLLVRELAKVIRPPAKEKEEDEFAAPSSSAASTSSAVGGAGKKKLKKFHSVYLNFDFPTPAREWKDTFDVWARGDIQVLAREVVEQKLREDNEKEKRRMEKEEREMKRGEKESLGASIVEENIKGKGKGKVVGVTTSSTITKKKTSTTTVSRKVAQSRPIPKLKSKPLPAPTPTIVPKKRKRPPPTTCTVEPGPPAFALKGTSTRPRILPASLLAKVEQQQQELLTPTVAWKGFGSSKPGLHARK